MKTPVCLLRCSQLIGCMSFGIGSLVSSSKVSLNQLEDRVLDSDWLDRCYHVFQIVS